MKLLILVFSTIFIAEMGDKTQLLLVAMAGKYKIPHILIGTWLATVVLNLMAVAVGAALSNYLDMRIIKSVAALAFFYFAYSTLRGAGEDEDEKPKSSRFGPLVAIFLSFFLGELGDKTQLSAITMAAAYTAGSLQNAIFVFLGCTLGLIVADLLGLLAGLFLKSKIPTSALGYLTFAIFTVFGIVNCHDAAARIFNDALSAWSVTAAVAAVFAALCAITVIRLRARKPAEKA